MAIFIHQLSPEVFEFLNSCWKIARSQPRTAKVKGSLVRSNCSADAKDTQVWRVVAFFAQKNDP